MRNQATQTLAALLANLATGTATDILETQYDHLYPASYDPTTRLLIQTEDN